MKYASNNIRNILIAGHAGSGKTTLTEALVYFSGAAERMGRVEDGTTISDFDPEEAKRKASLSASVVPVEYEGIKYNFIDAPGLFDFEAGEYEGIRAAESVLVCVSGRSGVISCSCSSSSSVFSSSSLPFSSCFSFFFSFSNSSGCKVIFLSFISSGNSSTALSKFSISKYS